MGKLKRCDSANWWRTPKTEAFITAYESVETAYEELMSLEATIHDQVAVQLNHNHHRETAIFQVLDQECVHFRLRQEMATSTEWHDAWMRFCEAVAIAQSATREFRTEIEDAAPPKRSSSRSTKGPSAKSDPQHQAIHPGSVTPTTRGSSKLKRAAAN